jgi:hypothetical protein
MFCKAIVIFAVIWYLYIVKIFLLRQLGPFQGLNLALECFAKHYTG